MKEACREPIFSCLFSCSARFVSLFTWQEHSSFCFTWQACLVDISRAYVRLLCSQLCLEFACMLVRLLCLELARTIIWLLCYTQFMHGQQADHLDLVSLLNQVVGVSHVFQLFLHAFKRVSILFYRLIMILNISTMSTHVYIMSRYHYDPICTYR